MAFLPFEVVLDTADGRDSEVAGEDDVVDAPVAVDVPEVASAVGVGNVADAEGVGDAADDVAAGVHAEGSWEENLLAR